MVLTPSSTSIAICSPQNRKHVWYTPLSRDCNTATCTLSWKHKTTDKNCGPTLGDMEREIHALFTWETHPSFPLVLIKAYEKKKFIMKMHASMTILFLTIRRIPLTKSLRKLFSTGRMANDASSLYFYRDSSIFLSWWFQLSSTSKCTLSGSALKSIGAIRCSYCKQ